MHSKLIKSEFNHSEYATLLNQFTITVRVIVFSFRFLHSFKF